MLLKFEEPVFAADATVSRLVRTIPSMVDVEKLLVFTVSMHTGLLDLIFILMLGFVIIASSSIKTNKRKLQY